MSYPDNLLLGTELEGKEASNYPLSKIIVLAVWGIVTIFGFSFFWNLFLTSSHGSFLFLALFFICLLFFLVSFLLNVFFIKSFKILCLIVALEWVALLLVNYNYFSALFLSGSVVIVFLFLIAGWDGQRQLQNMIKISFWSISNIVMPRVILGIAIFLSFVYYLYLYQIDSQKEFFLSRQSFGMLMNILNPFLSQAINGFNVSGTVDKVINDIIINKVSKDTTSGVLFDDYKKQASLVEVEEVKKRLINSFGNGLEFQVQVSDFLYNLFVKSFRELNSYQRDVFYSMLSVLIFFVVFCLGFPLRWLVVVLSFLVFESLIALGFASIILEGSSREVIVLK